MTINYPRLDRLQTKKGLPLISHVKIVPLLNEKEILMKKFIPIVLILFLASCVTGGRTQTASAGAEELIPGPVVPGFYTTCNSFQKELIQPGNIDDCLEDHREDHGWYYASISIRPDGKGAIHHGPGLNDEFIWKTNNHDSSVINIVITSKKKLSGQDRASSGGAYDRGTALTIRSFQNGFVLLDGRYYILVK